MDVSLAQGKHVVDVGVGVGVCVGGEMCALD